MISFSIRTKPPMEPRSLPSRSSCRRTLMLPPGSRKV
ncbi:MAG: hypothetical protein E7237_07275 [Sarcina sp.]|nr:hypothetical protein [Sarcina sp.]